MSDGPRRANTGLVAVDPDGVRHELGDVVLVNDAWGMRGE